MHESVGRQSVYSLDDVYERLPTDVEQLRRRIDNLRLKSWNIWCPAETPSLIDELGKERRCTVVDVGALPPPQNSIIATAVLGHFWRNRDRKQPVLIVVDEAHRVCPQSPLSAFEALSTELAIRIAGEGRKFGIYLLLATQRPDKVHPNVVSQCDNLVLMRMNSGRDLNYIAETFSQVPLPLLSQSPSFSQGEALVAGKIVSDVVFVKFEGRLTPEGGGDVPTVWAAQGYPGESDR